MLGLFRRLLPREDKFFDYFRAHSNVLVQGAEALERMLAGGPGMQAECQRIIALENEADLITARVMLAVRRSFITPFDRGDIKDLIQSMDDAIDMMHKTVKTVLLFEQTSFEPRMQEMGGMIVQAAKLTAESIPLLEKVTANAQRLNAITESVMRIEGRADEFYDLGLKELFRAHGSANAMSFLIGRELYSQLEKVMDRFEDVANEVSGIVIENV
jgi:uncharacterized protein Yka (UPF0111/DUF47 family)